MPPIKIAVIIFCLSFASWITNQKSDTELFLEQLHDMNNTLIEKNQDVYLTGLGKQICADLATGKDILKIRKDTLLSDNENSRLLFGLVSLSATDNLCPEYRKAMESFVD